MEILRPFFDISVFGVSTAKNISIFYGTTVFCGYSRREHCCWHSVSTVCHIQIIPYQNKKNVVYWNELVHKPPMLVYRELYIRKLPCVDYTVSGRERYTLGGVYPPIHMYMLPTAWLCVVLAYARLTQLYMQHRIAIKDLGHIHDTYPIIMHQD